MAYVKAFNKGFNQWVDMSLTQEEEEECRAEAIKEHQKDMFESIKEAKQLIKESFQHGDVGILNVLNTAITLFDKRASHLQYHREAMARKKFEEMIAPKAVIQSINNKGEEK